MKIQTSICVIISFVSTAILAQNEIVIPRDIEKSYEEGFRDIKGTPGPHYWQNHADYNIDVSYWPESLKVEGEETIKYYNESPDTLFELVIGLYQEVLNKKSKRISNLPLNKLNDETVFLEAIKVAGTDYLTKKGTTKSGTNLVMKLDTPIPPKSKVDLYFKWHFKFIDGFQIRTGKDDKGVSFVGYFYPKVAVYDDIEGWDKRNYNVLHEFYQDFNSYDVNITVPQDYIVHSTGRLQNPKDVLAKKYLKRYNRALESEKIIHIIDSTDLVKNKGFTIDKAFAQWHYSASIAPDFAFSVSKDVLWDARILKLTSKDVLVDAVYKKESKDFFRSVEVAADGLDFLSNEMPGVDYPYTDMTIVNGWAAMEFPMIINDPSVSTHLVLQHLTVHEMGHNFFPFYIGTNERKYAWMDEAWANVFPLFYLKSRNIPNDYQAYKLDRYYKVAGKEYALPIITPTDYLVKYQPYRNATYSKPSYALLCLRDFIGEEVFAKRLKKYFADWGFKHPIPYDFFGTFNPENDPDVNWFYDEFYYKNTYADLAVLVNNNDIIVKNKGGLPLGFELHITYKEGKEEIINHTALEWKDKSSIILAKKVGISKVEIINQWGLDVDKSNNIWPEKTVIKSE